MRILANCRNAMRPGGTIIAVERAMSRHSGASAADRAAVRSDLNMLLALTGRERTRPCLQASPFRARTGPRALVRWQRIRIARC